MLAGAELLRAFRCSATRVSIETSDPFGHCASDLAIIALIGRKLLQFIELEQRIGAERLLPVRSLLRPGGGLVAPGVATIWPTTVGSTWARSRSGAWTRGASNV
jgi:hypothetical protein